MNIATIASTTASPTGPQAGIGQFVPPSVVLSDAFPPSVRQAWRRRPTEELIRRLQILCACGPSPADRSRAGDLRYRRARKAAWEAYLFTSFACGLFEASRGNDLRRRLGSRNEEDFLSAIAECMTCWFLAGKHKLPLVADAPGRRGRKLDMQVFLTDAPAGVEVKAPFREPPTERVWCGDDSDKISQAMDAANKQLADDRPNLLVLLPRLRRPMYGHRHDLIKASFGQSKITWDVNVLTGKGGPTEVKFFPDGRFLNTEKPRGGLLKPDGFPAYRRISAVLCLEETVVDRYPFPNPCALLDEGAREQIWPEWERAREMHFYPDNRSWVEHNVLVLHNPYAYHSIPQGVFSAYPQLVPVGDQMEWTDGEEVVV